MNFTDTNQLREAEHNSIRAFVEKYKHLLTGRVLDYGCGHQPYRDLVTGEYIPYDVPSLPSYTGLKMMDYSFPVDAFDTVLCTQVLQYVFNPPNLIQDFYYILPPGGNLVMTYPTNWYECEDTDLWRFTKAGMSKMLHQAGFVITAHEARETHDPLGLVFGYGVVGEKPFHA